MTMLLTPTVLLADHSRTHPLLHDMSAMLASRRKPTDRQYVDSLNTMGPISARMFDETRKLTGDDRRAANREYLDRARLQEAFQALSSSASNAKEQKRFAEQRLLQPDLPRQHFELRSDGENRSVISGMYALLLHLPGGEFVLDAETLRECWGTPPVISAPTLTQAVRVLRTTLITAGFILPHPHDRLSAYLCQRACERAVYGPPERWCLTEDSVQAYQAEAEFLGLTPEADLNALTLQIQTEWTRRGEGTQI